MEGGEVWVRFRGPRLGAGPLELGFSVLACRDRSQVVRLLLVGEQLECLHELSVVRAPLCQGAFKKPQEETELAREDHEAQGPMANDPEQSLSSIIHP